MDFVARGWFLLMATVVMIFASAFIGGAFVYWSWNHVHGLPPIGYWQAFWLCMLTRSLVPQVAVVDQK